MQLLSLLHLVIGKHPPSDRNTLRQIQEVAQPCYEAVWTCRTQLFLLFGEVHGETKKADHVCKGPPLTHCHLTKYISLLARVHPLIPIRVHLEIPEGEIIEAYDPIKQALSKHSNVKVLDADLRPQTGITSRFLDLLEIAKKQIWQDLVDFLRDKDFQADWKAVKGKTFLLEHEFQILQNSLNNHLQHWKKEQAVVQKRLDDARKKLKSWQKKIYKYFKKVINKLWRPDEHGPWLSGDWADMRDFIYDFLRDEMDIMDVNVLINMLRDPATLHVFFGGMDHATKYVNTLHKLKCTHCYTKIEQTGSKCCRIMPYEKLAPLIPKSLDLIHHITWPRVFQIWISDHQVFMLFGETHGPVEAKDSCYGFEENHCRMNQYWELIADDNLAFSIAAHLEINKQYKGERKGDYFDLERQMKTHPNVHVYNSDIRPVTGFASFVVELESLAYTPDDKLAEFEAKLRAFLNNPTIKAGLDELEKSSFVFEPQIKLLREKRLPKMYDKKLAAEKKELTIMINQAETILPQHQVELVAFFVKAKQELPDGEAKSDAWRKDTMMRCKQVIPLFIQKAMSVMDIGVLISMFRHRDKHPPLINFFFGGRNHVNSYADFFQNMQYQRVFNEVALHNISKCCPVPLFYKELKKIIMSRVAF